MLLSLNEAAKQLSVSPRTIRRLLDSGELARVNVLGVVRIRPESVEAFVARNTVQVDNSACVGSLAWKGNKPCHIDAKTHHIGGQNSPTQVAEKLDALLAQLTESKRKR